MKRKILIIAAFLMGIVILLSLNFSNLYAQEAFPPGSKLPPFNLEMPNSSDISTYLQVKTTKKFPLSQIPAKLVVLEFFSVFCPVCQANTPVMNRLYQVVKSDQTLDRDIKVIGVALIGKANEIAFFKKKFNVKFPLFEDPNGEIQSRIGLKFVPLTLVVGKNGKIIMSHAGMLEDLDKFLVELRKNHKAL